MMEVGVKERQSVLLFVHACTTTNKINLSILHFVRCQLPTCRNTAIFSSVLFFYTTYQTPWNTAYGAFVAITRMWEINATWSTLECPSHHGLSSTKPSQHLCSLLYSCCRYVLLSKYLVSSFNICGSAN